MSNRPQNINYGAKDGSALAIPLKPIVISGHTGLVFGYGEKGPLTPTIVNGGHFNALFGSKTLDRKAPYFTSSSRTAEVLSGAGNSFIYKRILPPDNNTIANVTLYVDFIADTVDIYKRHLDGSIVYDDDGEPVVDKSDDGYRLKLISEVEEIAANAPTGKKTITDGYMTKSDDDDKKSSLIPIAEFRAAYQGASYNNDGITLSIPSSKDADANVGAANFALPILLQIINRKDVNTTGKPVFNTLGTDKSQFTFKPNAVHGLTNEGVNLQDSVAVWSNTTSIGETVYPTLDKPYTYDSNLLDIVNQLHSTEKVYANADIKDDDGNVIGNTTSWFDFIEGIDVMQQAWANNMLSAISTKNVPAMTFYMDDTSVDLPAGRKEISLGTIPIYLNGGTDGTMNTTNLNAGIRDYMSKYGDANDPIQDIAVNIESVLYDTGVDIETKKSLVNFIKLRKDTAVVLSTVTDGIILPDANSHKQVASVLKTELMMAPESTFHNTSVTRALIVVGSGEDVTDPAVARYPLTMHVAKKTAYLMGGHTWKAEFMFDRGGKNIIEDFINVEPATVSNLVADNIWNLGAIWPTDYDIKSKHFLSMQNVYDVERSALGNWFMAMALTVDAKVAGALHRMYSGSTELTPAQFIVALEADANRMLDVFDNVIQASAKVVITNIDVQNGFSWHLESTLLGNISLNVQHHTATVKLITA